MSRLSVSQIGAGLWLFRWGLRRPGPTHRGWVWCCNRARKGGAQIVDVSRLSARAPVKGQKVQLGETVVGIDGKPVSKPKELSERVQKLKVGQIVSLKLQRAGGPVHEVQATLTARPSEQLLERKR